MKYSEEQLRGFINSIPTLAWSASSDGSAEGFNQRWLNHTGLSADEASGEGWKAAIHADDLPRMLGVFQGARDSGQLLEAEGHAVYVSQPGAVAALIERAARGVVVASAR